MQIITLEGLLSPKTGQSRQSRVFSTTTAVPVATTNIMNPFPAKFVY